MQKVSPGANVFSWQFCTRTSRSRQLNRYGWRAMGLQRWVVTLVCQCGPTLPLFLIAYLCDLLRFGHLRHSVLSIPNVTLHSKK